MDKKDEPLVRLETLAPGDLFRKRSGESAYIFVGMCRSRGHEHMCYAYTSSYNMDEKTGRLENTWGIYITRTLAKQPRVRLAGRYKTKLDMPQLKKILSEKRHGYELVDLKRERKLQEDEANELEKEHVAILSMLPGVA